MRRRKKKTHFSSIGYPLGISVHRGPKSSQQPEKVVRHSLPLTDEETEAKKQSHGPAHAHSSGHKCQDSSSDLPPSTAPVLFPPHHADTVKADTAERKVTRWQASGICSSCTTGMSSVMAQPPCFEHRALPPPHLGWPCHLWGHVQEDKGQGLSPPPPSSCLRQCGE